VSLVCLGYGLLPPLLSTATRVSNTEGNLSGVPVLGHQNLCLRKDAVMQSGLSA